MTVIAAALIPAAPLLIPELVGDDIARDEDLRREVRSAVAWLCDSAADATITIVGSGPAPGDTTGTWDLAGFGVRQRGAPDASALPASLGVAAYFLDEASSSQARRYVSVTGSMTPQQCAEVGRRLAIGAPTALLIVGDGTARRDEKAPGYLDPRAADWDGRALQALSDMDVESLLALDPAEATELWADGRAPWQVLAGAAASSPLRGGIRLADTRYGVQYCVGRWSSAA